MTTTRRAFVALAACPLVMGMTPLMRVVLFAEPSLSPVAAAVVNELRKQGFSPSDDLKRWIEAAVTATNSRKFIVQATAPDATAITLSVVGTGTMRVNFGDGRSGQWTLTDTPQIVAHSYQTAARRPIVMIGAFTIS